MQIFFINNDGAGFASTIEVPDGTTIEQLFADKLPGRKAEDYLIRVDRQPVTRDQVLTPGCRVSITPTKIAGALPPRWRRRRGAWIWRFAVNKSLATSSR